MREVCLCETISGRIAVSPAYPVRHHSYPVLA
jgi:hypothetical protein